MAQPKKRASSSAIVASGRAIDLTDDKVRERYRKRSQADWWHPKAYMYDDEIGEIGFAHDYRADAMARVRPIPAILSDDPDAPPIPLDDETAPSGLDPELCFNTLRRLEPFPEFMGGSNRLLDVVGECHVALIPDVDELDGERCVVLSNEEYVVKGERWVILNDEGDNTGTEVPTDATVFRLWIPSTRFRERPTSHMRRLLLPCKELLTLTQALNAIATSRIAMNGGLLFVPEELSLETPTADGTASTDDAGDGEAQEDTFIDDLITMAAASISNPELAAAVIPLIVRGAADMGEKIKQIDLARPLEDTLITIRAELLGRIANGLPLPREIVLGVGGTNHWNADQIDDQTWHQHLEPRAMTILAATTSAFYRPALLAAGVDRDIVRRCVIWYDPTWFVGTPNLTEHAGEAYDKIAISGRAYRRAIGASEDDAPDDAEIAARLELEASRNPLGGMIAPPAVPADAVAPGPTPTDDPTVDVGGDVGLTAAGTHRAPLGVRLVAIERDLRTRLLQAADAAVVRALERAGIMVRNKAQGNRALLAQISDEPAARIPSVCGKATVTSLGFDDEELLAGALIGFETTYHRLVRRAQRAAARAAAVATGGELDEDQLDEQMAPARAAGWTLLAAGLASVIRDRLFNPDPTVPMRGEFDDATTVPVGLVRAALDRAGGAQVHDDDRNAKPATLPARTAGAGGPPGGGGATAGPDMLDQFKTTLGIVDDHYEWVYGDTPRAREFEPHLALDGVIFTSWDDEVLANGESFPDTQFYRPSDHDGCACDFAVSFVQAGEAEEAA